MFKSVYGLAERWFKFFTGIVPTRLNVPRSMYQASAGLHKYASPALKFVF
jgi:hypothetical protein